MTSYMKVQHDWTYVDDFGIRYNICRSCKAVATPDTAAGVCVTYSSNPLSARVKELEAILRAAMPVIREGVDSGLTLWADYGTHNRFVNDSKTRYPGHINFRELYAAAVDALEDDA